MKAVLMASPKGLHLLFEYDQVLDRQPIVPGLIYDTSALVRDHLFIVLGKLLCEWNPRDRYQYGELVLPIILSGTLDDLPSVQITCKSSMSKVGLSCTQDLVGAGILDTFPADEKEAEIIGIKHLVHMCYDKSVSQLMHSSTNFVKVRQETGLDSLKLFLEYASVDDLVRSIKRLTQCLFQVYATTEQASIKTRVYDILTLLLAHLPSPEICIEVLTLKLDRKRLAAETEGFPGNLVVTVTMAFLEHTLSSSTMSESSKQRVISIMSKPYLTEYLDLEATQHYQQVVQAFQKI
ncbi:uncharacterized protein B0P05DRAFT_151970 [Gilbertella persicaria]|uniref:uncharacterized protein n=1 Tax=Gilbertella persicaria TaxID=101096 RepID=UPI00221F1303|nr:uncharacterized protein B0P05DRAFT_151970 [Gilbertella persicaria]KAI8075418.1 hypothetical protein B0P05DRAFT_151970 [Gilbertella persicaria]